MKVKIKILPDDKYIFAECGESLSSVMTKHGYFVPAFCGGNGVCGKCKVKLLEGEVDGVVPDEEKYVLSCKAKLKTDLVIQTSEQVGKGLDVFIENELKGEHTGFGIILDIGTTTMAAGLIDLRTGRTLQKVSCLNPQIAYGADVLSRIKCCADGKLQNLQEVVLQKTEDLIQILAQGKSIEELVVAANTTMLHLFLGVNPQSIGIAPFIPVFTDVQRCSGKELGLSVEKVRLLPSAAAYIGSDITAGVLACEMANSFQTELFVDIGTNGEIVLVHNCKLYATSTAAGPAFEGACIECGLGGVEGAIEAVTLQNGQLGWSVIGNVEPKGICGSGLINLIALLYKEDIIDENGTFNEESNSSLISQLKEDRFYLNERVYLSQKDIRQFQLAKSAIRAGIETLLVEQNIPFESIRNLYIAGGLGYYMNIKSAGEVGLFPKELLSKIKAVGNTSLAGARLCLVEEEKQKEIDMLSKNIEIIELSYSKHFQESYMLNISFGV